MPTTEADREAIARRYASGEPPGSIAKDVGVTRQYVDSVRKKYGVPSQAQDNRQRPRVVVDTLVSRQEAIVTSIQTILVEQGRLLGRLEALEQRVSRLEPPRDVA